LSVHREPGPENILLHESQFLWFMALRFVSASTTQCGGAARQNKKHTQHERRHAPKRTSNSVSASTHEIGKSNISKNDKQRVSGRTE